MPRKITNNSGLPIPMFNALKADTYVGGGDISITKLIAPPRQVALRKFHEDEIEEDADGRIWMLLGNAVHRVLELSASDDVVVETRLFMPIEGIHTDEGPLVWRLSGQPDVYQPATQELFDYKVTSVWSVLFGDKPEWEAQVNLQAMLHRNKGDKVLTGSIIGILRDWSVRKARFEKDYPPRAVKKIGLPMWTQEECIAYAQERVKLHQIAQRDYLASGKDPDVLPLCTPEERWYRGASFAVKRKHEKTGKVNKKADRLFKTEEEANKYIRDNANNIPKGTVFDEVEERPGENIRCLEYCDVAEFCSFGRALKAEQVQQLQFKGGDDDSEQKDLAFPASE